MIQIRMQAFHSRIIRVIGTVASSRPICLWQYCSLCPRTWDLLQSASCPSIELEQSNASTAPSRGDKWLKLPSRSSPRVDGVVELGHHDALLAGNATEFSTLMNFPHYRLHIKSAARQIHVAQGCSLPNWSSHQLIILPKDAAFWACRLDLVSF